MRNLFRQYQPFCFREMGPLHTLPPFLSSRVRVAWSAAAVGGNGAEAITRRKLTFLGEITFTKYLISSPAKERRACAGLSSRRGWRGEGRKTRARGDVAVPYRSRYGIQFLFVCRRAPAEKDVVTYASQIRAERNAYDR